MKNFLLIHGGSHGAWCWEKCAANLEAAGNRVFAIDLPGHGLDQTPRETLSVQAYLAALNRFIDKQRERKWSVVGHSLAGRVLPEFFQAQRENIAEVIFIAAMALEQGEAVIDHVPNERRPSYFKMAEESDDNTFLVNYEVARQVFFNDLSEAEARHYYQYLSPQALPIYLEPARVGPKVFSCPKRYIVCRHDNALGYQACLNFAKRFAAPFIEIEAGHDVMLSQPEVLAKILIDTEIT